MCAAAACRRITAPGKTLALLPEIIRALKGGGGGGTGTESTGEGCPRFLEPSAFHLGQLSRFTLLPGQGIPLPGRQAGSPRGRAATARVGCCRHPLSSSGAAAAPGRHGTSESRTQQARLGLGT